MVVQHNMQALNANRMLGVTTGLQAKSTEKLSSGYKINRAADDAAGLSISEKMRKQINGLDQASINAQDGISAVQTAEGALTEVHSMLQRMNELAVQAANGTNSEADRQSIQDEIDQLTTEIDRVAETTKFNETYLLKGNGKDTTVKIAAKDAGIPGALTGVGTGAATFKMDELKTGEQITIGSKGFTIGSRIDDVKAAIGEADADEKVTINGTTYTVAAEDKSNVDTTENIISNEDIQKLISDGDKVVVGESTYVAMTDGDGVYVAADAVQAEIGALADGEKVTIDGTEFTVQTAGGAVTVGDYEADIEEIIDEAATAGDTVSVNGTTYTIAAADDTANGKYTAATLKTTLAAVTDGSKVTVKIAATGKETEYTVKDGDTSLAAEDLTGTAANIAALATSGKEVVVNGKTVTVGTAPAGKVAADGVGDNDASIISMEKAYDLIAKELEAASSIGTDPGQEASITQNADGANYTVADGKVTFEIEEGEVETKQGLQFTLHVGADADENNKIALTIDSMDSASLGVKGINIVDNTGAKATYAIDSIADAVAKVSSQRSALGAIQNRLEHTIANLDNVVENTTSAESSIRDTDMAEEMVNYSKNNILAQAGQAMLAQANQSTQGALSLLG